jgi:colanic acid biosynthesis glycosyl transferase WcaI
MDRRAGFTTEQPQRNFCEISLANVPTALVFYHYLYPDDVVSAVHISELCEELVLRGWAVTAMPSNRCCREDRLSYPESDLWRGVKIRRIWRPALSQASALGRFLNAIWMVGRWSMAAFQSSPDVVIVGTDPILSVTVAIIWKLVRPNTRVAHWCFDLYPEAAIEDRILRRDGWLVAFLKPVLRRAYGCCDLLADIGSCMSDRLQAYQPRGREVTLTPWALSEPHGPLEVDSQERQTIFGMARLALMYSGNFGRAHSSDLMLELIERLAPYEARLALSVRGNRAATLIEQVQNSLNVKIVPFANQSDLDVRLSAADIHVVTLRDEWTGTVVPSKFFGALAVGRPVLFVGSPKSAVARWIVKHRVGWVLTESSIEEVASELIDFADDPAGRAKMFAHCHTIYRLYFSKQSVADQWDGELRGVLDSSETLETEASVV